MSVQVYLDYNATTPYAKEVRIMINHSLAVEWGNPSSSHALGRKAKERVETSRQEVAKMISACPEEIIFTSGGTESNYTVIENAIKYFKNKTGDDHPSEMKPHFITTNIEHPSIDLHLRKLIEEQVIDVTFIEVSKETGQICLEDIEDKVQGNTCLITVMMANNETGIIQPVIEIGNLVEIINLERKLPILFHTDAAQAIGKIECSVKKIKVDFLTIAGHKFYGPRTGALYVRNLSENPSILCPVFYGGGQERGYRPGTENTAMIAGLGKAAELVSRNLKFYHAYMVNIRNYAEAKLLETFKEKVAFNNKRKRKLKTIEGKIFVGDVPRLPNTLSIAFPACGISGYELLQKTPGICASTGAACHSSHGSSSVLVNSGVDEELANCTLRLSIGRETTKTDIDEAVNLLLSAMNE